MDEVIADLAWPHAPDEHKNELLAESSLAHILAAVPRGDKMQAMPAAIPVRMFQQSDREV
jgi:hypothetical protein